MLKLFAGLAVAATTLLSAADASAYTLKSPEAGFAIELPKEPQFKKASTTTASGATVDVLRWSLTESSSVWSITYTAYPPGHGVTYDNAIQGTFSTSKCALKSRRSIRMPILPGVEIACELPSGAMIRAQLLILGPKFYQVMYAGPKGSEYQDNVNAVLKSFSISR